MSFKDLKENRIELKELIFEEEFPSLKRQKYNNVEVQKAANNGTGIDYVWFEEIAVSECCLDKQKVREEIEKMRFYVFGGEVDQETTIRMLLDGLGL